MPVLRILQEPSGTPARDMSDVDFGTLQYQRNVHPNDNAPVRTGAWASLGPTHGSLDLDVTQAHS